MRLGPDGFRDRREAGRLLAERLAPLRAERPIVLALPRGGVPVAYEVAQALHAPLDLVIVRKIGAPGHEEYAIGAVVDGDPPQVVRNGQVIDILRVPESYIAGETARQLEEIARRRATYLGGRPPLPVEGRTAIVVDDGIATGATVKAALRGLAQARPARLVLAVPVAPPEALAEIRPLVDEMHCLLAPDPFRAVGLFYDDFSQTADEEVVALLQQAAALGPPESAGR
jgi:putative phosphoribosyl transferase